MTIKIQTPSKFSKMIRIFATENNVAILEAVIDHCQKNNMEIETAAKLLTTDLKRDIANEARALHNLAPEKPTEEEQ